MKNIFIISLLFFTLLSCSLTEKNLEEKTLKGFESDINALKNDLYNTPIGSEEFAKKAENFEKNIGEALEKNMYQYQINTLLEAGDDLSLERDIKYSISIFDNSKDTSQIEKLLVDSGYRIGEKKDIFGMMMFYVFKKHPVDPSIIAKDEKELNSILKEEWISYDGWDTDIVNK